MVSSAPPAPDSVGKYFVHYYYQLLGHSPELVYKFYQDDSQVERPGDDDNMSITTTIQGIKETLASLKFGEFRTEIKSVSTQASFNGGVLVLVTGNMTGKEGKIRSFTQSFFLAPQQGGYYVLNDIFSYVEFNANDEEDSGVTGSEVRITDEVPVAEVVEEPVLDLGEYVVVKSD